jgi:hypothetical protein
MEIPKDEIQQLLREHGDQNRAHRAHRAHRQLAHSVDGEQHSDLLARIGINLNDLARGNDQSRGVDGKFGL